MSNSFLFVDFYMIYYCIISVSCMKAVKYLRKHPHAITDKQSAIQVYGIGEKLADHIDEFLKTGDVQHWEDLRARLLRAETTPKA